MKPADRTAIRLQVERYVRAQLDEHNGNIADAVAIYMFSFLEHAVTLSILSAQDPAEFLEQVFTSMRNGLPAVVERMQGAIAAAQPKDEMN